MTMIHMRCMPSRWCGSFTKICTGSGLTRSFSVNCAGESLMMLTMCCLDSLEGTTKAGEALSQVQIDPRELLQFIMKAWAPMNELCEQAGFSERRFMTGRRRSWATLGCPFKCHPLGDREEGSAATRRVKLQASEVCRWSRPRGAGVAPELFVRRGALVIPAAPKSSAGNRRPSGK